MSAENDSPATFDMGDLCRMLKCSDNHVRNLVKRGDLPEPVRYGGLVRWHRDAVLKFIAQGTGRIVRAGVAVETRG